MTESGEIIAAMRRATPARLGIGRAGVRYPTAAMLKLRADHARAVDAVRTEVSPGWVRRSGLLEVRSRARTREEYLLAPELGRRLEDRDVTRLKRLKSAKPATGGAAKPSVLLCVGDGLSSHPVERNSAPLLRALKSRLATSYRLLPALFIRNARVRIEDHIGEILRPDIICMLVGERPGLATSESLSAYVIYRPTLKALEPERTVISNIHPGGITIAAAAKKIAALVGDAIRIRATGASLAQRLTSRD